MAHLPPKRTKGSVQVITASTQQSPKYPLLKAGMLIAMCFVTAITLTSMVASAFVRWQGGNWETLSFVGSFWAGHLGSLALLFLAWSLYIQQREFDLQRKDFRRQTEVLNEQRKAMEDQLRMMQRDHDQGNLLFLMEHLKELSRELEFTVHVYEDDRIIPVRSVAGICVYLEWQQSDRDALGVFVKDYRLLREYVSVIDHMEATLDGDPVGPARTIRKLCDFLYPPELRDFYEQLVTERKHSESEIDALHLSEASRRRLRALIVDGWRVERAQISSRKAPYTVLLINDALPGAPKYSSREEGCQNWEEAVKDVLKAMGDSNNAGRRIVRSEVSGSNT